MIKISGKVIKEIYRNGDFRILSFSPTPSDLKKVKINNYGSVSLKGDIPMLDVGSDYTVELEEAETTKYGTSYKVVSVPSLTDIDLSKLSVQQSKDILMSFTTERQADSILSAYPDFIYKVINEGKDSIDIKKIKGVGEVYLACYVRELTNKYKYLHILDKYKDYKLTVGECKLLYQEYMTDLDIENAMQNKIYYTLIQVLGRSFSESDKTICWLREDLVDSIQRAEAMVMDVLKRNEEDGSTRMLASDLWYFCKEYDSVLLPKVKDVCINSEYVHYNEETKYVALVGTYMSELRVADFIKEKLSHNDSRLNIDWTKYKVVDGFEMTDEQSMVLQNFCDYEFSLLLGNAGSGKSSSIKGLVALLEDNGLTYTMLTPTGKASMRLTEATNRPSSTIHRKCLRDGSIDTDVIIVDETSMVDLPTFKMLIDTITNEHCRIVLVADNAQLLPVGIGNVLNDIVSSNKVPMAKLTKVFRYNDNGVLYVATEVRQGHPFLREDNERIKVDGKQYKIGNNYTFIQSDDIFKDIIEQYTKLIDSGVKKEDILVLSPYNVGEEGTYKINEALQAEFNSPKANESVLSRRISNNTIKFRLGDFIINTKNDYKALTLDSYEMIQNDEMGLLTEEDVPLETVFNGECGKIVDVDDKKLVARIGENFIVFNKLKLNNLLLSSAISTHKSQGSESKYVINVVSPMHERMLNRNLLYVGVTRSKIKQIDIGDVNAFNNAVLRDGNEERDTYLLDMLTA